MKVQTELPEDRIADLKLRIIQQQQLAGTLFRLGMRNQARGARAKLLGLLDELGHVEEEIVLIRPRLSGGRPATAGTHG